MYISKKDAEFYTFEDVALKKVLGLSKKDLYINEAEIKDLMQRVSSSFNIDCPKFKYTRSDSRYCYYLPSSHAIYFNRLFGMTTVIVLHELCHAIHRFSRIGSHASHGDGYARIWIDVMSRMFDVDKNEFEKIADELNIKYVRADTDCVKEYKPKY